MATFRIDTDGEPQALGATVTLVDGAYQETDTTYDDPLSIYAASDRGGRTYDIRVTKPTSVVDTTLAGSVVVAVQGHPAAVNDPPCS